MKTECSSSAAERPRQVGLTLFAVLLVAACSGGFDHHASAASLVIGKPAKPVESAPVEITANQAQPQPALPVVSISAAVPETTEPSPNARVRPGVFVLNRSGDTTTALRVFVAYAGTATAGEDYTELPAWVEFPAGESSVELLVAAKEDALVEADETVVADLRVWPLDHLPDYAVDQDRAQATVVIHDNGQAGPATIEIRSPLDGERLPFGVPVNVHGVARDPKGYFGKITLSLGGRTEELLLGLFDGPPLPGTPWEFEYIWRDAQPGTRIINARGKDSQGLDVSSGPVTITVGPKGEIPMVKLVAGQNQAFEDIAGGNEPPARFYVTRTGPTDAPLEVQLKYEGSATPGLDFVPVPLTVVIPAGAQSVPVNIYARVDDLVEPAEVAVFRVALRERPTLPGQPRQFAYGIDPLGENVGIYFNDYASPPKPPVVFIEATDAQASEPLPGAGDGQNARLLVKRIGDASTELTIPIRVEGTATPGEDYKPLAPMVRIPAGERTVVLEIVPLPDDLVEGDETVVVSLQPDPSLGPIECYRIDPERREAKVTIHDRVPPPQTAHLTITAPRDGESFAEGMTITIAATAIDPKGYVPRVEFLDGDVQIGVSELMFFRAPDPGTPIKHQFEWRDATQGEHLLRARGRDADGKELVSSRIRVVVAGPMEVPVVSIEATQPVAEESSSCRCRCLPLTGEFTVRRTGPTNQPLKVFVDFSGTAQNGLDYEPLPWLVAIPAGRQFTTLEVKAKPDNIVEGDETVVATLSDCPPMVEPLLGMPCVAVAIDPDHASATVVIRDREEPADQPPQVAILKPKNGAVFTVGDTIELRAEASDPDGKVARLDLFADERLLESTALREFITQWSDAAVGPHALIARAVDDRGAEGHSAPVKILVREVEAAAFVQRALPPAYVPGQKFGVALRAEPPTGTSAYAVEDHPPAGWVVGDISHDGMFDAVHGSVKFGPFTDNEARTLTYLLLPPSGASGRFEFAGLSSINGKPYPIGGARFIEAGTQFTHIERQPDGRIHLKLAGRVNRLCVVETSSDLVHWTELEPVFLTEPEMVYVDDTANGSQRYYRTRIR